MDLSSFGILTHDYLRIHYLVFVARMSKHMNFKCLTECREYLRFKNMLMNFRK